MIVWLILFILQNRCDLISFRSLDAWILSRAAHAFMLCTWCAFFHDVSLCSCRVPVFLVCKCVHRVYNVHVSMMWPCAHSVYMLSGCVHVFTVHGVYKSKVQMANLLQVWIMTMLTTKVCTSSLPFAPDPPCKQWQLRADQAHNLLPSSKCICIWSCVCICIYVFKVWNSNIQACHTTLLAQPYCSAYRECKEKLGGVLTIPTGTGSSSEQSWLGNCSAQCGGDKVYIIFFGVLFHIWS